MSTSVLTLPSHMAGFLHELGPPSSGVFTFISYPNTLMPSRAAKFRSELPSSVSPHSTASNVNIMSDRRVVRGNTYSINRLRSVNVTSTLNDEVIRQRRAERRSYVKRRTLPTLSGRQSVGGESAVTDGNGLSRAQTAASGRSARYDSLSNEERYTAARARVRRRLAQLQQEQHRHHRDHRHSLPPLSGKKHSDIQTEQWLEEISDRAVEADVGVQTDEADAGGTRPQSPLREAFRPPGLDKTTQIMPDDPDLFVFEEEVVLVLDALVAKTMEQSLIEIMDEEQAVAAHCHKIAMLTI
jgi:hypothetical protein